MKILFLLISPFLLFAKVHYAKVEPYESILLKSSVSALVVYANVDAEGTLIKDKQIIVLDDALDKVNIEFTQNSVLLLEQMLQINQNIAKSLNDTVKRQEGYYQRINKLSTASKTQKDNAYSAFSTAKTQYLSTREKIISLEKQILELGYKVRQLEDSIAKKSIVLKDKYLYKLLVRKGDFVNAGTPLAEIKDVSRAKLVLFLASEEIAEIEHKILYLNGEKTDYKIDKIWNIADEKFISSYRAEIYIPSPKDRFSKLIKVEIK
ncbi:MAG: hypothetical protein Q9M36_05040 [Sulfurovum sp.]|nr:hypothetical protein [Sulfurovum sp.]